MDRTARSPNAFDAPHALLMRTGYVVCAFVDEAAREQACRALLASEFDIDDLTRLDALQMGVLLNEELERNDADSHDCCERLDHALHAPEPDASEEAWLLVLAANDRQVLMAQRLLRTHGARRAIHFGPMWIEDLATRR